jgi:hypothetical protein
MTRRLLFLSLAAACLAGCDTKDMTGVPLAQYESDPTEALIREMLRTLPDPSPGVPKSHAIALGEIGKGQVNPASVPFMERFSDLKLRLVSPTVMTTMQPDNIAIDPELRVAAYVLQIRKMKQTSARSWDYDAAWSYKRFFQRQSWRVTLAENGRHEAVQTGIVEGNWPPQP